MKPYLLTLLFALLITPAMAQNFPPYTTIQKRPENLKPLDVNVPQPDLSGTREMRTVITPLLHKFEHDGKLVYYNGSPLPDSDYRKKVTVVKHFYERHSLPMDMMMSAIPPVRLNHILYISNNGNLYYQNVKLQGADPDSFEGVAVPTKDEATILSDIYVKSNNRIYYKGKELEGINAAEFRIIRQKSFYIEDNLYTADRTNVYYCGSKLRGADAKTFELLSQGGLGKDKSNVFYKDERIKGVDGSTFTEIDHIHYKDKVGVYMLTSYPQCNEPKLMANGTVSCNGISYSFLSTAYRNAFLNPYTDNAAQNRELAHLLRFVPDEYRAFKVIPADPETFEVVEQDRSSYYTKDKNHVYLNGEVIEYAQPQLFKVSRNSGYSADSKSVFYEGKQVKGADPLTFRPMEHIYKYYEYYKDSKHIYHRGKKVAGLTPQNFDIARFYFKENGSVWLRIPYANVLQFRIADADVQTFQTFDSSIDDMPCPYAKDKNHAYYRGLPMVNVDVPTFRPYQNSGYAYDKQNLYFNGEKVERPVKFDPASFVVLAYMEPDGSTDDYLRNAYARDLSYIYYNGKIMETYIPGIELELYDTGRNQRFCIFAYYGGRIYCRGKLVKKSRKDAIRIYHYGSYASPFWSDEASIYYEDKRLAHAGEGLRTFDSEYAIIGNNRVFYGDKEIEVSDAHTFRTDSYGHYARDRYNVYFEGIKVERMDSESFYSLGLGYAQDKSHLFYNGKIVENVKPNRIITERITLSSYLTDGKYAYYQGKRYKLPK